MNELTIRTFSVQKNGNPVQDYEDAYAYDISLRRFAVADGATESSFARLWAEILVREFVQRGPKTRLREWLVAARKQWNRDIPWADLPWYAEEKTKMGSHSTFAGFWFSEIRQNQWHALAIGDSCLFQVREQRLVNAFPLASSTDFGNRPGLVSSIPVNRPPSKRMWRCRRGSCQTKDIFVLATDAVAQWCLSAVERGAEPWLTLVSLASDDEFRCLVDELRLRGEIRNDDSSVLIVEVTQETLMAA